MNIVTGFDSATLVLMLLAVFLAVFPLITMAVFILWSRLSASRKEVQADVWEAEKSVEKRVEDEFNEIKEFNQKVTDRLQEVVTDQATKDLYQTISQGQAALWKRSES